MRIAGVQACGLYMSLSVFTVQVCFICASVHLNASESDSQKTLPAIERVREARRERVPVLDIPRCSSCTDARSNQCCARKTGNDIGALRHGREPRSTDFAGIAIKRDHLIRFY